MYLLFRWRSAISGPKKVSIFRGPSKGFARIKIIKSKRHIKKQVIFGFTRFDPDAADQNGSVRIRIRIHHTVFYA